MLSSLINRQTLRSITVHTARQMRTSDDVYQGERPVKASYNIRDGKAAVTLFFKLSINLKKWKVSHNKRPGE